MRATFIFPRGGAPDCPIRDGEEIELPNLPPEWYVPKGTRAAWRALLETGLAYALQADPREPKHERFVFRLSGIDDQGRARYVLDGRSCADAHS